MRLKAAAKFARKKRAALIKETTAVEKGIGEKAKTGDQPARRGGRSSRRQSEKKIIGKKTSNRGGEEKDLLQTDSTLKTRSSEPREFKRKKEKPVEPEDKGINDMERGKRPKLTQSFKKGEGKSWVRALEGNPKDFKGKRKDALERIPGGEKEESSSFTQRRTKRKWLAGHRAISTCK